MIPVHPEHRCRGPGLLLELDPESIAGTVPASKEGRRFMVPQAAHFPTPNNSRQEQPKPAGEFGLCIHGLGALASVPALCPFTEETFRHFRHNSVV